MGTVGNTADDETNGENEMLQTIIDAWLAARRLEKARKTWPQQRIIDAHWESYLNDPGEVPYLPRHIRDGDFAS